MTDTPDKPGSATARDPAIHGQAKPGRRLLLARFAGALREQDWAAAALEVVIVVFGIVIGFQVTEWGEQRELRARVDVQLEALREDFRANRVQLTDVLRQQESSVERKREMLRVMHGASPRPEPEVLAGHVFSAVTFHRFEPVLGAYDALLNAGDLRLVGDPELRGALASFAEMADTGFEDEEQIHDIRVRLIEFLAQHGDILSVVYPSWREGANLPPSSMSMDVDALLSSPEFSSLLTNVAFGENQVLSFYKTMEQHLDAVLRGLGVDPQQDMVP